MNPLDLCDIIDVIFRLITSAKQYKTLSSLNRLWYTISKNHDYYIDRFSNHLATLMKLYPGKTWCIYSLSSNPNIDEDFVRKNANIIKRKPGVLNNLSANPAITWDMICSIDIPWTSISENPNITYDIYLANNTYAYNWDLGILLKHCPFTPTLIKYIEDYNTRPESAIVASIYMAMSINPNLPFQLVINNPTKNWNFAALSRHPKLEISIIKALPNKKWDWRKISSHPNMTWDIINSHLRENASNIPWDWCAISQNPNITWETVKAHPDWPWDWSYLILNSNITVDIIRENPQMPWDEHMIERKYSHRYHHWSSLTETYICSHPNFGIGMIHPNLSLADWHRVSADERITLKDIQSRPDLPWDYSAMSENPNITWRFVRDNIDKHWNWKTMSSNPFKFPKKQIDLEYLLNY